MNSRRIKTWTWIHKWSSLVCTAFMLLLCITGLPLIFHHEIGHLLGTEVEAPAMAANAPRANLDRVIASARALYPQRVVQYVSQEPDDDKVWFVTLTPTPAPTDDFKSVVAPARQGSGAGSAPGRGLTGGADVKVHPHHAHRFWPLWGWPIALGLLTAIGLVSALFSDGGWGDALAWLALGAPVVAGLWFGWGRPREADQNACRMPKS